MPQFRTINRRTDEEIANDLSRPRPTNGARLLVRVPLDTRDCLYRISGATGLTMSCIVRQALGEWLSRYQVTALDDDDDLASAQTGESG